jgi:acyl-CoA synthetase (AMP-forming)/AMP-acid ligase II
MFSARTTPTGCFFAIGAPLPRRPLPHRWPPTLVDEGAVGEGICALVILTADAKGGGADLVDELREQVAREIGKIARPREIHVVPELPKTRSGKIMRRLLRDVADGRQLGDTSTLVDPAVFEAIRASKSPQR